MHTLAFLLLVWMAFTLSLEPTLGAQQTNRFAGMVRVPGGAFTMGREDGPPEETPVHEVVLPPFYIDKNLVTIVEYAKFIRAKGPFGPKGEMYLDVADPDNRIHKVGNVWQAEPGSEAYPASEMSWYGAVEYCKWVGKRLPSEAEWEKAARGTDKRLYPWGNEAPGPDLAFFGGYRGETVPVGQFSKGASPYGVLDMAGQVWEWTRSVAARYPYDPKDGREDLSAEQPRVTRGGSSSSDADGLTATSRHIVGPARQSTGHAYHGFRCVSKIEMVL